MARKEIDKTKSATFNEGAINDNFEELYGREEGGSYHTDPVSGYDNGNPFGGVVDNNNFDLGNMLSAINSVLIQREVHDSTVKLQATYVDGNGVTRDSYTHGPNICIYNGKAYVSAFYNPQGSDHADGEQGKGMSVAMFIFNLSTWTIDKVVDNGVQQDFFAVARHGFPVGSKFIASGACEPFLHVDNGVATVVFSCRISDNAEDGTSLGEWVMCYRDYNIANGTWGDIQICQFKAGDSASAANMTAAAVQAAIIAKDPDGIAKDSLGNYKTIDAFEAFAQYAELQPNYYNANHQLVWCDYKEYYMNLACESLIPKGAIIRTRDFKTFTLWLIPQWPNGVDLTVRNEMALMAVDTAWGRKLRVAARTHAERTMFIGTIDFDELDTDGVTVKTAGHVTTGISNMYRFIPDGGSRPCWFKTTLSGVRQYAYLAHMTDIGERNRAWAAIDVVESNTLAAVCVSRVATTLSMVYPSIAIATIGGKQKYVVAYMRGGRVYIAHFSLPRTFNELIPIAAKIIDTFGPEE